MKQQSDKLAAQFDNMDDAYLRERKQDMLQVVRRIHNNLIGQGNELEVADNLFDETVLIANDLHPPTRFCLKSSALPPSLPMPAVPTGHTAILGRSLDIPSVVGLHNARKLITEGETVIVDGINGVLIISPDESVLNEYRRRAREYRSHKRDLNKLKNRRRHRRRGLHRACGQYRIRRRRETAAQPRRRRHRAVPQRVSLPEPRYDAV